MGYFICCYYPERNKAMWRGSNMSDAVDVDLTGCKVLIVDDVPANLDVLVRALDGEGYNVHVASDGPTALKVADHSRPDIILLDVMMPEMNGYETCRQLKTSESLAAIPVIFLTARDDVEGVVEGFSSGGVDYVTKPFNKDEVLARLRTHLERATLARNLAELNEHLEQKVRERTSELRLKVSELEGKDRIAQHMLKFHSLEETLAVVLEVVVDILELDQAVVYLKSKGALKATAALGLVGEDLDDRDSEKLAGEAAWAEALATAEGKLSATFVSGAHPRALVPIARQSRILGIIDVENPRRDQAITASDLDTLSSFALQAAVAINDAQVRLDPDEWKDQLDEVLELNEELEDTQGGN